MKRLAILVLAGFCLGIVGTASSAAAQGLFKIPFKFEAGGKKLAAGEYRVAFLEEGKLVLRKEPGGEDIVIPFTERLKPTDQTIEEPQLVFDVVGNFEPSYTEYVTDYLLSEVWFPGEDGFLIHRTKGAHQNQVVKGLKAAKSNGESALGDMPEGFHLP